MSKYIEIVKVILTLNLISLFISADPKTRDSYIAVYESTDNQKSFFISKMRNQIDQFIKHVDMGIVIRNIDKQKVEETTFSFSSFQSSKTSYKYIDLKFQNNKTPEPNFYFQTVDTFAIFEYSADYTFQEPGQTENSGKLAMEITIDSLSTKSTFEGLSDIDHYGLITELNGLNIKVTSATHLLKVDLLTKALNSLIKDDSLKKFKEKYQAALDFSLNLYDEFSFILSFLNSNLTLSSRIANKYEFHSESVNNGIIHHLSGNLDGISSKPTTIFNKFDYNSKDTQIFVSNNLLNDVANSIAEIAKLKPIRVIKDNFFNNFIKFSLTVQSMAKYIPGKYLI